MFGRAWQQPNSVVRLSPSFSGRLRWHSAVETGGGVGGWVGIGVDNKIQVCFGGKGKACVSPALGPGRSGGVGIRRRDTERRTHNPEGGYFRTKSDRNPPPPRIEAASRLQKRVVRFHFKEARKYAGGGAKPGSLGSWGYAFPPLSRVGKINGGKIKGVAGDCGADTTTMKRVEDCKHI